MAAIGCSGTDSDVQEADAKTLRTRNLALAYIDSGMMNEAGVKLEALKTLLPKEAFCLCKPRCCRPSSKRIRKSKHIAR